MAFWCICSSALTVQAEEKHFATYNEVLESLASIVAEDLLPSEVLRKEFRALTQSHGISSSEAVYREFVNVKLAFEATRDSGLWQIVWRVTDNEPNSDHIWQQWSQLSDPRHHVDDNAKLTAIAECDELSALFAFIARGLGVKNVGLFWPTWNHTVGVWTTEDDTGKPVRIVIPTSQIFISTNATIGTREFDPYTQKTIYNYDRQDVSGDHRIPAGLAEMMIHQVQKYASKPTSYLQARRNNLSRALGGS